MANIETGVDKLVKLIQREKKIEIGLAAKELGVSPTVVQEWADFLEEEGLVETQYSLSKTFLVEKRLSTAEVQTKGKEFEGKREAFTRKVDSTLKQLENETADFETIKKQYYALKDQIGDQIDAVKDEIDELRHYEELKKGIDQDILKQKIDYQKTIDEVHVRVIAEEKRYSKIIDEIRTESARLKAERSEFVDIKKEEDDLMKRVGALQDIMKSVTGRLSAQTQVMSVHEERLGRLRELAEKLQRELEEKKVREIEPLIKVSKDQEQRILRIQDEIVGKIKQRRDSMQAYEGQAEEIAKRFGQFFERRARTEVVLKELESSKSQMKEDLNDLIRKAKAFDIASQSADTNAHIKQLEGKFHEFDKKRDAFAGKLEGLKGLIMGAEMKKEEKKEEREEIAIAKAAENSEKKKAGVSRPKKRAAKKKKF